VFIYFCREHVEDDAAAFGEQGDEGDAATEGVQLPEAVGLHGASTNGGVASGMVMNKFRFYSSINRRTTNSGVRRFSGVICLHIQLNHLFAGSYDKKKFYPDELKIATYQKLLARTDPPILRH
jgi:hypothetical protein